MSVAPFGCGFRRLGECCSHRRSTRAFGFEPYGKFDLLFDDTTRAIIDFARAFLHPDRRVGYRCNGMNDARRQTTAETRGYIGTAIGQNAYIEITPNTVRFRAVCNESIKSSVKD